MTKHQADAFIEATQTSAKGNKITVYHPVLSPEERERREVIVKKALCRFYEERMREGAPFPLSSDEIDTNSPNSSG